MLRHKTLRVPRSSAALLFTLIVCLLTPIAPLRARADVTIVQTRTVTGAQLPPAVTGSRPITTYISGQLIRVDSNGLSLVVDASTRTVTRIDRTGQTYCTHSYPANHMLLPRGADAGVVAAMNPVVTDRAESQTIAGRLLHHYTLTINDPEANSQCVGDLWMATDLTRPSAVVVDDSPFSILQARLSQVPGIPVKVTMTITGGPLSGVTAQDAITSVSVALLPASTFAIPAGYLPVPWTEH